MVTPATFCVSGIEQLLLFKAHYTLIVLMVSSIAVMQRI